MKVHGKRTQHDSAVGLVTGRTLFVEGLPSGKNEMFVDNIEQAEQKKSRKNLVGKQVPHDSAVGHVTGEALFVDDLPSAKNELIVDYIASPVAHGKIKSLNYEEMAKLDGIVEVFTHADIPGHNLYGPVIKDERFLAEDIVEYVGQPIAIIAGKSRRAIQQAKKHTLLEIQELTPVFTIDEAITAKQFIGVPRTFKQGNFDKAWRESKHKLTGTFVSNGQEQFYLESQAALAWPGEYGEIQVHSSSQNPTEIQEVVAEALGLGFHEVVCVCKRMGGGFGGKETQAVIPAVMAALVAAKTQRPARVAYSKDDDMRSTGKRHPYKIHYKAAFTSEGKITGVKFDIYSNGGAAADLSTAIMERTLFHSENAYFIPNLVFNGTICKTNFPPNTAFRGFGGPQGMANIENVIQEIAIYLKKDALEVRRLNCYSHHERNVTPYGQIVQNHILPEIIDQLARTSEYRKRMTGVEEFNRQSTTHLRGLALTPMKFGISFTTKFLNQGNALVNVYKDGTVQVSTGGTEMGQGLNTKIRQLVADEFAISYDDVRMMITSTEKNNNTPPTAASAGTDLNGFAAVNACQKIRSNLSAFASRYFASEELGLDHSVEHICFEESSVFDDRTPDKTLSFRELVQLAFMDRVSMGARGFYRTPEINFNRDIEKGEPFFYYTTGAAVSEVLIDRFTGYLKLERSDLLMDIGESINPGIDRGQIIGGFIQGVGWVTNEDLRYSDKGELLSYSPTTYKIPNIQDLPEIFNVDTISNPHHQINIRRSKAVAEPPLMLCLSVWIAVKHALSFVQNGVSPQLNLPATGEEILRRLTELTNDSKNYGTLDDSTKEPEVSMVSLPPLVI
ncbi:MAG: xanthine dehydrogenase molybdopterin binding subunit [SAR324 cluster bacterium]|nr:xanthine dehydrogenase molybdopterin binding subunit [SAR324 cluster bacterium]